MGSGAQRSLQLDGNFTAIVKALQEQAGKSSDAFTTFSAAPWDFEEAGKEYDDDEAGAKIRQTFNRDASIANYLEGRKTASTSRGHIIVNDLQADFLAGMQRDYKARHRTRIRLIAHRLSRREGDRFDYGTIHRNTVDAISRVLKLPTRLP